jgi:hypothetical protein
VGIIVEGYGLVDFVKGLTDMSCTSGTLSPVKTFALSILEDYWQVDFVIWLTDLSCISEDQFL